ncbi:hypothetical protein SADUNF_Sadunf12G0080400 [Salix dunnii]|uniref:UBL3-like ubiquitin domain-containing protein n=1 Tax=Salix dunnii TaxID=1413687 RepID=A0A835JIB3_9ROSI|nr:hypothetical protein SADUNF_Sadunf12G0080400 [Salix dunnii]
MPEEDLVDIKFRLYDGSDIGPFRYSSTSTVDMLKQRIVSDWPRVEEYVGKFEVFEFSLGQMLNSKFRNIDSSAKKAKDLFFFDKTIYFRAGCKTITPKAVNEIKLISSGKVLDNNKTVGQCRTPFGEVAGGVIIMHVVVQPSLAKTKTEKKIDNSPKKTVCSCSIM